MKKLKNHIFTHTENIVIGGDVASLLFAFSNDYYITFTEPQRPFFFDKFSTGEPKEKIWDFLFLQMMYRGKILGVYPNQSIRREEDIIKIITNENSLLKYKFKNVFCLDPTMLSGLSATETKDRLHRVVHEVKLSSSPHNLEYHYNGDEFIKEMFFKTLLGTQKRIFCCSELRESALNDFKYGEVTLRYKLKSLLEGLGLRGPGNGKDKFLPLKLTPVTRTVVPMEHHLHEDERIKFIEYDEDKLWNSQISSHIKKWSESSRWMDLGTTGTCRMLLSSVK